MKKGLFLLFLLSSVIVNAQFQSKNLHKKSFSVKNDSVKIDSVSINPFKFKVFSDTISEIDSSRYIIDFSKALLIFKSNNSKKYSNIIVQYNSYPDFLTKKYFDFDDKIIVPNDQIDAPLYSLTTNQEKSPFKPFEGLNTAGNITRGLTVGNNQNGVVNSSLDLQIAGKLSDKITLKASIIDTNLPIQENGNTYKLNEFDRVFMELFSDNWSLNAGDIYLNNQETSFLNFNKKVSGLRVNTKINNENSEIAIKASGAIVRGKYNKVQFIGNEGNQGPYNLSDFNNKYVLILSGTEKIYVNGRLLKRGENNDYTIDYNTAELTFTTTFPVTANMRISAEYQFNDRVYTRFITYNNISYKSDKLSVSGYFYNENDLKNQSLEQDLSNDQKLILANSGNNTREMVTPSAYLDTFSEDKILYRKISNGATNIFEYSINENDELYQVSFSYVGENLGNYTLKDVIALGKIYEYKGENLGDYNPTIQLVAPEKLQVAVFKATYNPSTKTTINTETAFSTFDQNLFSKLDDSENNGLASKFSWDQIIFQHKWELKSNLKFNFINERFKSVERVQNIEFNRDWNIENTSGDQKLLSSFLELKNQQNSTFKYLFENLEFGESFTGNKHHLLGNINKKNSSLNFNTSILNNETLLDKGTFTRYFVVSKYNLSKSWFGIQLSGENNKRIETASNLTSKLSHKFNEYEAFMGIGDSTKVYTQFGANFRSTDSIQNNTFKRANNSKTYYLKSTLINTKRAQLNTYINYRTVENTNFKNEESLNSKIFYKQQLFNQFLSFNTVYENKSGNLPQQDYSYIKTEPGQGFYTWIDYNNDNIKDLNEFEIAQFADQATYLRIILPTINYIATQQNKFTQNISINPQQWNSKKGLKKLASHFYNQTYLLVDSKQKKSGNSFNLNPFDTNNENLLGLNYNLNNSLFFNKGKKNYSTTYSYIQSKIKNTTTIDDLENEIELHKIKFEHKIGAFWQLNFDASNTYNNSLSLNFNNRNYKLKNTSLLPKISYYYNDNTYFSLFYESENKKNKIGDLEALKLQKLGFEVNYASNAKNLLKADLNLFKNNFTGNSNSPIAYHMLEGLQPGENFTWSILFYRKINSFLNLNLNYLGRKSESSNAIHTGTIQLKALF
ncbi:hypothetical protein [Lutibacter citreus]|uniref:hypothetical protein n=1 Tax=Lutibacter citreus TaxID=2138210 RepID=UPI000DBE39D5|nr:hypothetical protein [Lutibacter citreus]